MPNTVLDALEEDLESTANGKSESGDDDAPLVRHVESSDNMVHPEFEANVEQIHLTTVGEPSQVDAVQFNFMRDDGVQGEVGVSPPLAEVEVSEDYISEAGSEGVLEFAAEEEAEMEIPQHGGFKEAFLELDLLSCQTT